LPGTLSKYAGPGALQTRCQQINDDYNDDDDDDRDGRDSESENVTVKSYT